MSEALTGAVGSVVKVFTTNVVPLITTEPFVYFLGASILGLGIAVFRKLRGSIG